MSDRGDMLHMLLDPEGKGWYLLILCGVRNGNKTFVSLRDAATSPQNEPLVSLQGWRRLSDLIKAIWWKKDHWIIWLKCRAWPQGLFVNRTGTSVPATALNPGVLSCTQLISLLPSLPPPFPFQGGGGWANVHHHLEEKEQPAFSSTHPLYTCILASAMLQCAWTASHIWAQCSLTCCGWAGLSKCHANLTPGPGLQHWTPMVPQCRAAPWTPSLSLICSGLIQAGLNLGWI